METGHYEYDPVDKHGPLLYYFSLILNKAIGVDASDSDLQTAVEGALGGNK